MIEPDKVCTFAITIETLCNRRSGLIVSCTVSSNAGHDNNSNNKNKGRKELHLG